MKEDKVKEAVSEALDSYKPECFYRMVVPCGYGKPELDYHGCYRGRAFYIETKRPGKGPRKLQEVTAREMRTAGGKVLLINQLDKVNEIHEFFASIRRIDSV